MTLCEARTAGQELKIFVQENQELVLMRQYSGDRHGYVFLKFLPIFRKSGNMFRDFRNFGKPSEIFGNLGRIYWVVFFGG